MSENSIIEILNSISAKLEQATATEEQNLIRLLSQFAMMQDYLQVDMSFAVRIANQNSNGFLCMLSFTYEVHSHKTPQSKHQFSEFELVGIAILKNDYGHTFIQPETIADKINELFDKVELDFECDKIFSSKFYVLSDEEEKFRASCTPGFMKAIRKAGEIHIEILGRTLLVRYRKSYTPEIGRKLHEFICAISASGI